MNLNSTITDFFELLPPSKNNASNLSKSFQSVDLSRCTPSILLRDPELRLHLNLPHPPGISNKPHQPLPNILDIIVLM